MESSQKGGGRDNRILIVGAVGAAGLVGYMLYKRNQEQAAATMLAAGVQPPRPTLAEILTGTATSLFSTGLSKLTTPSTPTAAATATSTLSKRMQARGDTHFLAWSAAFRKGQKFYVVGKSCFETSTGNTVATSNCPVLQLEGVGNYVRR